MKKTLLSFTALFCAVMMSAQFVVADRTGWQVIEDDSHNNDDPASKALDGWYHTLWHTPWGDQTTQYPHWVTVDMGQMYSNIPAFLYRQRNGGGNGSIKGYELYFSNDPNYWGTAVATGEFTDTRDWQAAVLPAGVSARYFKFVATSPIGDEQAFASAGEIGIAAIFDATKKYNLNVFNDALITALTTVDKTGWTATADSQHDNSEPGSKDWNVAQAAIDDNPQTFWHTEWGDANVMPHNIVVNMGQTYTNITNFRYLPRQQTDHKNGMSKSYELYFSTDGTDWGTAVATGEFPDSRNATTITLPNPVTAQYFKLVVTSAINGSVFAGAAELDIMVPITNPTSNLYLQKAATLGTYDDALILNTMTATDASYEFAFIPTAKPCIYNIKIDGDYFLIGDDHTTCKLGAKDEIKSQVLLEEKDGKILIRVMGSNDQNAHLGFDALTAGNYFYGNKFLDQYNKVAYFELLNGVTLPPEIDSKYPAESSTNSYYLDLVKVTFNRVITLANAAGITVKNSANQNVNISVAVAGSELQISHAPFALGETYTVTIPANAISDFANAISWSFTVANPTLPTAGIYNIINTENNYYLTYSEIPSGDSTNPASVIVSSDTKTGNDAVYQEFILTIPDAAYPDRCAIQENVTEKYLVRSTSQHWRTWMRADANVAGDTTQWVIVPSGSNYKIQAFLNRSNNSQYLAPNNSDNNVACYSDKNERSDWNLVKLRDISTAVLQTATNDPIVSTEYYTLQGLKIDEPQRNEVYIVRQIRKSGAVMVKKEVEMKN